MRELVEAMKLRGQCALAVDGTGVGAPVVDLLLAGRLGCEISAVTITGGEREHQMGNRWSVPKQDLISRVQVLLERGELRIARRMREAGSMVRELLDVRLSGGGGSGRVRLGADGLRGARRSGDRAGAGLLAGAAAAKSRHGLRPLPGISW